MSHVEERAGTALSVNIYKVSSSLRSGLNPVCVNMYVWI